MSNDATIEHVGCPFLAGVTSPPNGYTLNASSTGSLLKLGGTGRITTLTDSGSDITVDATNATFGEGWELRWKVVDWADVSSITQFQGLYLRVENQEAGTSKTLRGAEITARDNNVGIGVLHGLHVNAYIKGSAAGKTIGQVDGIQAQVEFASNVGTRTITNNSSGLHVIVYTAGTITNVTTKLHGIIVTTGDQDGQSTTIGNGILFEDSAGTSGTNALTTLLKTTINFATGIDLSSSTVSGDDIVLSASGVINSATSTTLEIGGAAVLAVTASAITLSQAVGLNAVLTITSTTNPQLVVKYDAADYLNIGVADTGDVLIAVTGTADSLGISCGDGDITITATSGDISLVAGGADISMNAELTITTTEASGITLAGASTDGIVISGATTHGISFTGTASSAHIYVNGTALIASGEQAIYINCTAETAAVNGVWVTLDSTVTSGDMSGGRYNVGANAASAGANLRAVRGRADMTAAGKYAAYMCGGMFEVSVAAGTATISGNIECLVAHFSQGTTWSCANFAAIKAQIQTRGTGETITTVDTGLWIVNEAVNGNGRTMDSAIKIAQSNMGGGTKAYGVLIDASGVDLTVHDTDRVTLILFKDSGGTERKLVFDPTNNTVVAVQT